MYSGCSASSCSASQTAFSPFSQSCQSISFGADKLTPELTPQDYDPFDGGTVGYGLVDHLLEVEDLSPVKPDVGRNDQLAFGILNAACEGRGAESGIDHI